LFEGEVTRASPIGSPGVDCAVGITGMIRGDVSLSIIADLASTAILDTIEQDRVCDERTECARRCAEAVETQSHHLMQPACLGSRAREDVAERLIDRVQGIGTMWCGCRGRPLIGSRAREDVAERLIDRVQGIGTMWCGCRGRPLIGSRAREDVAERLIDRVQRIGTMWCGCRGRPLILVAMQCRLACNMDGYCMVQTNIGPSLCGSRGFVPMCSARGAVGG
jgi:hypothetical protein